MNFSAEKFGEQVRSRRQELGMTQRDLAVILDVSPTQISDIEKGKSTPSLKRAFVLAEALYMTLDELIGVHIAVADTDQKPITTLFDTLTPIQQAQVLGYIDRIKEE